MINWSNISSGSELYCLRGAERAENGVEAGAERGRERALQKKRWSGAGTERGAGVTEIGSINQSIKIYFLSNNN